MAVITEKYDGRSISGKSAKRQYWIKGAASEADARAAFLLAVGGSVAATVNGWPFIIPEATVDEVASATDVYEATAVYQNPEYIDQKIEKQQPGEFSISFDISGETRHITQSRQTITKVASVGDNVIDFQGAICVSKDGTVEGCDIVVPRMTFSLKYTVDPDDIDDAYIATLKNLIGTVNNATFKGFPSGELLFTNVSGSRRNQDAWDLNFGFAVSKNETGKTVGGLSIGDVKGWDFLWFYYEDVVDEVNHFIIKSPRFAYVERVYEYADYSGLGLP